MTHEDPNPIVDDEQFAKAAEPDVAQVTQYAAEPDTVLEPAGFDVAGNNVIVEAIVPSNITEGGVFLPDSKQRPPEVVVVGVGPFATVAVAGEHERPVRLGDVLVIHKHQTIKLESSDDGRELLVLTTSAIIGIAEHGAVPDGA